MNEFIIFDHSYSSFLLCLFFTSPSQMYWLKDVSLTNVSEKGCMMKWNKERREENGQRRRRRCRSFPLPILLCIFLLPLLFNWRVGRASFLRGFRMCTIHSGN